MRAEGWNGTEWKESDGRSPGKGKYLVDFWDAKPTFEECWSVVGRRCFFLVGQVVPIPFRGRLGQWAMQPWAKEHCLAWFDFDKHDD